MVKEGDIIEITDASLTKNEISLLGRRYDVKSFKGRAKLPELGATALIEGHEDYNPQANGTTWESVGLSNKGRPNKIPAKSYKMFKWGDGIPDAFDEAKDEKPKKPSPPVQEFKSVAELVAKAAEPFQTIRARTNNNLEPFINDRELDYDKMAQQPTQLTDYNDSGFRARVIFSAPIDYTEPEVTYKSERDFFSKISTSAAAQKNTIIRQYEIGKKVQDIMGNKAVGVSKFNCFRKADDAEKPETWNHETVCVGLTIVLEDEDCPPHLIAHLESDGQTFTLKHRLQSGITLTLPEPEPAPKEASPPTFVGFGGLQTTNISEEDGGFGQAGGIKGVNWESIIHIPCFDKDSEDNKFPRVGKKPLSTDYDIRAVMGITFDHDAPALKKYEKPYEVNWDEMPSIMANSKSNGFVEAQFEVNTPPEGRPTDRLPGANIRWLRAKDDSNQGIDAKAWKNYPRLARVILPGGDAEYMDIPIDNKTLDEAREDTENAMLSDVDEVKYYTHKEGNIREMRLIQTKKKRRLVEGVVKKKITVLQATWKVGDDYEFRTQTVDESNQWQNFRGRLIKIIVNKEVSRENAYKSAAEERRNQRLFATKDTNQSDIFFTKDPQHPNSFVIAVKNIENKPFSGQIIRINLGGK